MRPRKPWVIKSLSIIIVIRVFSNSKLNLILRSTLKQIVLICLLCFNVNLKIRFNFGIWKHTEDIKNLMETDGYFL